MAYDIKWDIYNQDSCRIQAEEKALKFWNIKPLGYLYRFVDCNYGSGPKIEIIAFPIVKFTPKGCVIKVFTSRLHANRRFVLNDSRKRFAHKTIDKALSNYIMRKRAQARIYEARMREAQDLREKAQRSLDYDPTHKKGPSPMDPFGDLDT